MKPEVKKIAILIEADFYENEIFYYQLRFAEEGIQLHFLSRLWNQDRLTFLGHEFRAPFICEESFEDLSEADLAQYAAIIVPAGMVSDRLRYTEDVSQLPPVSEFMKKAFANKNLIKGIICHGMWLMSATPELVEGRRAVVHNNLLGDARNMGIIYVDKDVVVDADLVTARTGGHCNFFAKKIIELIKEQ
ncbi:MULTISPECIES: DJ-1/PfpI family protein [unclassified Fusibacter]|uniref:DJ-1/PfpI family protein n=1 Tax=unclassified Fusibacter TaxID=2624464 RepID=UPI0010120B03|nr:MULTISPECIES: DJ-1/PfpI family protein [unclassified Fusibacter]MCK8058469.1 DJ-1/PfpI family protein [Fusibacter sp. A2]NPE22763.1 thiamine biosynthesis protein ThiJ [Fusibacter sp. A1]RXV60321.1 thiamine biosynthesis protein ThiJ [Fusibacter sp. A1]